MCKIAEHELKEAESGLDCQADCVRPAVASGTNGFQLPFCRPCLEKLPRWQFDKLVKLASRSIYDEDARIEARESIIACRRMLSRRTARRLRKAVD